MRNAKQNASSQVTATGAGKLGVAPRRAASLGIITICLCCLLMMGGVAKAQVVTADVIGSVTDSAGAVVPNATVIITNLGTNELHTAKSSENGEFTITLLPVGNYSVKIESPGFKTYTIASVSLSGGDRTRLTAKMEVGQVSETIEVTTQAAALQTDNSTIGETVTATAVQDLPLNGRNFVSLATLAPGATQGGPNAMSGGTRPDDRRQSSAIAVNGQNETQNNYMIDGMDNNERYIGSIGVRPSVDAMQEFRVETSLYSANVTRTAGGVINVITKAGTNGFHGTLFEFFRNDLFDANSNYNFGAGTLHKGEYRQNQFGGSLGGPIIRNKTFFFGDYEGLRIIQGVGFTDRVVPTVAQKAGNFSSTSTPILDPALCPSSITAASPYFTACNNPILPASIALLQFPGNQIPASRIDSTIKNLLTLFPNPTSSVVDKANYVNNVPRTQNQTTFDVRVDHRFNDSNMIFGRYSYNDVTTFTPNAFPLVGGINGGGCVCATGNGQTTVPTGSYSGSALQRAQNAQINYTHTFTPNTLLTVRTGYLRLAMQSLPDNTLSAPTAATKLGIPGVNLGNQLSAGLPQMTLFPYASLGDQLFVPELVYSNTYQANGDLHWNKGPHAIIFGANILKRQVFLNQSQQPRGFWAFNSTAPSGYKIGTNNTMADFLLDMPFTFTRSIQMVSFGSNAYEFGSYVQDDWRATSKLTVNLGLRYDIFTPFAERNGYQAAWSVEQNKMLIANTAGVNKYTNANFDLKDFSPRIGFALTVTPGLVLRGGYGITYYHGLISQAPYLQNVPFYFSNNGGCSSGGTVACPTLLQGTPVPPPAVNLASANNANLTGNVTGFAPNLRLPYIEQFSLNLQKDYKGTVFGVGYVGTVGRRQTVAINQNLGRDPSFSPTVTVARPLTAAGIVPNNVGVNIQTNAAASNYNSLQFTAARRTSHGLTANANYVYAKSLGNAGGTQSIAGAGTLQWINNFQRFDYGRTGLDVRHRVAVQINYVLPFAHNMDGVGGYILKNWQVNTVYQRSNGLPFTVLNPSGRLGISGGGADRPNRIAQVQYPKTLTQWFNPAAFQLNTIGTPGTEQVYSLQGPAFRSWDLSLIKPFPITERVNLQFRAEGFNILNTANFLNPNSTIPGTTFDPANSATWGSMGQITGLAGAPRQFQFAAKIQF